MKAALPLCDKCTCCCDITARPQQWLLLCQLTFLLLRHGVSFGNGMLPSFGNAAGLPNVRQDCCYCRCCCCFDPVSPCCQGRDSHQYLITISILLPSGIPNPPMNPLPDVLRFPMWSLLALFLFCITTHDKPCH